MLEPTSRKDHNYNARSAWWLCTSAYALGYVVMLCAPRCLASSAPKTKEISLQSNFRWRGLGRSRQKKERIFLCFGIAASSSKKLRFSLHLFERLPLCFSPYSRRARRAPVADPRGNSRVRSLHSSTFAQLAHFVRASCCGAFVCVLGDFVGVRGIQSGLR